MNWLARLFSPRKTKAAAPREVPAPRAVEAQAAPAPPEPPPPPPDSPPFVPWLLGCQPLTEGALSPVEQQALATIDKTLALAALPDELLPRAAALIPQLLAMLRQTDLPVPALAQRVVKDAVLAAEVLRLASSPYYRAQGAVTDLGQAIALIGVRGLQTVIARVVLKPIYEATPGPLSARASARLWDYADAVARHSATAAYGAGQEAFDGYLAGLLHSSGWTIALRVLDRAGITLALPPSAAFAAALDLRAHRLFGQASQRWVITPAFTSFGADARVHPLATSQHPLAAVLRQAQPEALIGLTSATT